MTYIQKHKSTPLYVAILLIPLFNGFATSTVNYFPPGTINPGTVRAFFILLVIGWFSLRQFPMNKVSLFILIALLYWGLLAFFSSNPSKSLYEFLKFALPLLLFPIGYQMFSNPKRLDGITQSHMLVLAFFLADIVLANIFGYGRSDYYEGSFYFGSARVNITKSILVILFIVPIAYHFSTLQNRKWLTLLFIIGLLVALVGIKRSVLIAAIVGLMIYFFLSPFKGRILKLSLIISILLLTILSFYLDLFVERFQARGDRVTLKEETIETEARYSEVIAVSTAWVSGSLKHKLIGSELFNDTYFFRTNRMLHTDYMIILNGSGLIGIWFWFMLLFFIIQEKNKYYFFLRNDSFYRQLNTVFWMLISAQLIISISGTVYDITLRSVIYLYLGSIISNMRSKAFEVHIQNE